VKSVEILLVSDGVPVKNDLLSMLSFRKFQLSPSFISCTQAEILLVLADRAGVQIQSKSDNLKP